MRKKKKLGNLLLFAFFAVISIITMNYDNSKIDNTQKRKVDLEKETISIKESTNLNIYFLDVGQADSILIESNNKYTLVDAGNNSDGSKLVKFFKDMGIPSFDYVVATHAHEDHIGGMDDIVNNFEVDNFYIPDYITTTKTFEDLLNALESNNVALQVPKKTDKFSMGDVSFEVLYVDGSSQDINDSSIVLRIKYGSNSFLLMGDVSSKVEKKILNDNISSDLIKVGHHGSKNSSSSEFLDKVRPQFAIISVGQKNNYDHPNKALLSRLESRDIKTYRTDIDGTIKASSNGTIIKIETLKTDTNGE